MIDKLKIATDALREADSVLFDVYSNAQKLDWIEIEKMCHAACEKTRLALEKINDSELTRKSKHIIRYTELITKYGPDSQEAQSYLDEHKNDQELGELMETAKILKKALTLKDKT